MSEVTETQLCLAWLLFFVACSAGCSAFSGGAKLFPADALAEGTQLAGIAAASEEVFVLYVHGMGSTEASFSDELIARGQRDVVNGSVLPDTKFGDGTCGDTCMTVQLPEQVYVRGEGMACTPTLPETDPCRVSEFGQLRKETISGDAATVHVYSYFWDSSAAELQQRYSYKDIDLPGDAYRPLINRSLKQSVVTYGFSDAALYIGAFGKTMRRGLESALCLMLKDALTKQRDGACLLGELTDADRKIVSRLKIVFVAKSLGSRYLLDTLLPADQLDVLVESNDKNALDRAKSEIKTKKAVAASMSNVYFLANQLPLLGLGRLQVGTPEKIARRDAMYCSHIAPLDGDCEVAALGIDETIQRDHGVFDFANAARAEYGRSPGIVTVYAYHDPADLLGYKAGYHFTPAAKENVRFVEIVHRNATQWLWLFAPPAAAHAKEDQSDTASRIIWCGATVGKQGKLVNKSCP